MKNKPGTFSPADITRLCQLQESANNRVELRYSNASKVFHASLHLVNPIDAKTAVSALIRDKFITKEYTYQSLKEKAKDDDIMELSSTLSLKCPLSVQRIEVPCRSSKCTHLQCFDAYTFLSINQRVHRWVCPVCNRAMDSWEEIIVDGYYLDILESTPKNLDNVNISPDGKWVVLAPRTSLDMTSSIPMLSDSKSSSSGTKLNRADKEPIYVIDDDDEEESTSGSRDSRDNEMTGAGRMDSSMEVEEVEVYNPGSKEIGARTRRQEGSMQPSNNSQQLTVTTIPPAKAPSRSESSLLPHSNSQPVPREHHFMDLTLYPSTDVIDLTTDSEDEDRDRTLVYGMTRRVSVQPSNGVRNSSISTENVNKNGTSRKYVASTAILNNHTNNNSNRISIESLLGTSSCVKLSEVTMDDTFESGRVLPGPNSFGIVPGMRSFLAII
ncbi:SUMO ligase siz1 [Linnemannia zychae]|nr:SUMO ligase siz1 [Linnemannia zychae]